MNFGAVYLMLHIPFVFFVKIGITTKTASRRAAQINRAMFGFPVPIMVIFVPNARGVEAAWHRLCADLSVRFYKGDGHTEWFWIPAGVPVFGVGVLYWWGLYEGFIFLLSNYNK